MMMVGNYQKMWMLPTAAMWLQILLLVSVGIMAGKAQEPSSECKTLLANGTGILETMANVTRKVNSVQEKLGLCQNESYEVTSHWDDQKWLLQQVMKNADKLLNSVIENNATDMLELLLDGGGLDVNKITSVSNNATQNRKTKLTLISQAVLLNVTKTVEVLVKRSANLEITSTKSHYTPLMFAAMRGLPTIAEYLAKNSANVNAKSAHDKTALHHAVEAGHITVIEVLRKYGANIDCKDSGGFTPLMLAVDQDPCVVKELILMGADKSLTNNKNQTAFDLARNKIEILESLNNPLTVTSCSET